MAGTPRKKAKAEKKKSMPKADTPKQTPPPVPVAEDAKQKGPKLPGPSFIVGMGGSAGALEAFEQFFHNIPPDSGLAFILVPHLDPTHKGIMPELLQRFTPMKVSQAREGLRVRPNNVYVIPPNKDMGILNGVIELMEPSAPRGLRLPIDFFFRHLAEDQKERSIGIILSGMGTDGTLGIKAIKEQMGMAMVQEPGNAKYDGMPRSALNTGVSDFVANAEELPAKLIGYVTHFSQWKTEQIPIEKKTASAFQKILMLLRARTGNDFSLYKKNTVIRRIDRRMSVHQIPSLANYVTYLQENPHEIELLFKELLINVTNFFRDPEAFERLRELAILPILRAHNGDGIIRVWVPGCSSGEEAYSIAMLFREAMDAEPALNVKIQMYGTDIDQDAINQARQGLYPANIVADVSPERIQRFFTKEETHYRIRKEIREMVVFAPQNIIGDPPFTKLDLLTCRNLMIYLTPEIQKKLLPLFHYALNQGGYLFLGSSETVSGYADLYDPLDQKWKIFRRRESISALTTLPEFPARHGVRAITAPQQPSAEKPLAMSPITFQDTIQRFIVETISPPVIVINEKGELLHATRRTGKFLEPPVGNTSLNVFDMAREGLRTELAIAVRQAIAKKVDIQIRNLMVKTNGERQPVNVTVKPINDIEMLRDLIMVIFEEIPAGDGKKHRRSRAQIDISKESAIAELEKDLQYTKEHLQTTVEEMETSQEELKSTNEELQSTNEELQSTNEELTTSKEELQSLNEELMTVNTELQAKNDELALANNDMRNLLNSTQIPTLFLDNNLKIKRYTTPATALFTLIPGDVGRPITDIASKLEYTDLVADVQAVIETLVFKEIRVRTQDGRWYIMRIMPYRTMENLIDGVVITFVDITDMKRLERVLEEHDLLCALAGVVKSSEDAVVVQDMAGKIRAWNHGAEVLYGIKEEEALGMAARDLIAGNARRAYESILERIRAGEKIETIRTKRVAGPGRWADASFSVTTITGSDGVVSSIALIERPGRKKPAASG